MSMTVADALAQMAMLDNELQVESGEADEDAAITALLTAQQHFETLAANYPQTYVRQFSVTTAAATETSTMPTTVLRVDSLWALDAATGEPIYELDPISRIGGHVPVLPWPLRMALSRGQGQPARWWADENYIYWTPKPDAIYTLRGYGLVAAASFDDRDDAFAPAGMRRPEQVSLAIAAFADKLLGVGTADPTDELEALATTLFTPILRRARHEVRGKPDGRAYSQHHTT